MAKINIDAELGAKGFLKGTKDMENALEDVSNELENVGQTGDSELESLTDKIKQSRKAAETAGEGIGKGLKDGTTKGVKGAEDGLDEFKGEANSTAKESAASFDGSAESIVDSFQEIAANAFAGFGPAGAIAGLALAAGIGLGMKGIEDAAAATEEYKTKVNELTQAFIESGEVGKLSATQVIDEYKKLATATEDGAINLRDIKKASDASANSFEDLADALAGNTKNLDDLIESEYERLKVLSEAANYDPITQAQEEAALEEQRVDAQEKLIEKLKETKQLTQDAAENEKLYIEAGVPALEARAAMQDVINKAYDDAASSIDDWINKETGVFDVEAYVASMQAREQALIDYQNTLASSGLSDSAKQFLNEQGVEAASTMLSGYTASSGETKRELARIWDEAGKEGSGAAEKAIEKTFKTPKEAKITATVDSTTAQAELDALAQRRIAQIQVDFVNRYGQKID